MIAREESLAAWLMSLESPCGEETGLVLNAHEYAQTNRTYCTATQALALVGELSDQRQTYHFSRTQVRTAPCRGVSSATVEAPSADTVA